MVEDARDWYLENGFQIIGLIIPNYLNSEREKIIMFLGNCPYIFIRWNELYQQIDEGMFECRIPAI